MNKATKKVQLIIGLGKTGLSCAEHLNTASISFMAMDTRDAAPYAQEIAALNCCQQMLCGNPDLNIDVMKVLLEEVSQIIISPGVARTGAFFELVDSLEISIIGDIELFAQSVMAPVIAITGSNGKSTVTELTGQLLKAAGKSVLVGGNIGTPALDLLKQSTPDIYVLELSSFQLESIETLSPIAGTVLNLSKDHLDRYDSFEDYCAVKLSLLEQCENIIINCDEFPQGVANQNQANEIYISSAEQQPSTTINLAYARVAETDDFWITKILVEGSLPKQAEGSLPKQAEGSLPKQVEDSLPKQEKACAQQKIIKQSELKIAGLHNLNNAMVALALCSAAGVECDETMKTCLREFTGLKHRCQFVAEKAGVRCYNDSKGTNVGATLAALKGLSETTKGKLILIAGGQGKGVDFSLLAESFKRYLSALVLIGQDAERILHQAGNGIRSVIVDDMTQAVAAAFGFAQSGDAIILSPACASFDMYSGFDQRGDVFIEAVEAQL